MEDFIDVTDLTVSVMGNMVSLSRGEEQTEVGFGLARNRLRQGAMNRPIEVFGLFGEVHGFYLLRASICQLFTKASNKGTPRTPDLARLHMFQSLAFGGETPSSSQVKRPCCGSS